MMVGAVCIMPWIIPPVHQSWGKSCTEQLIDLSVLGKKGYKENHGIQKHPGIQAHVPRRSCKRPHQSWQSVPVQHESIFLVTILVYQVICNDI